LRSFNAPFMGESGQPDEGVRLSVMNLALIIILY